MSAAEVPEPPTATDAFGAQVVQQIFDLFISPEVERRNDIQPAEVRKALVLLPDDGPAQIQLNDEASVIGTARATRDIAAGEELTMDDITDIGDLRPEHDPGDKGWVALVRLPNGSIIAAFDFRRNKNRARRLVALSEQYFASAREAKAKGQEAVAVDATHTAAELAVTALMNLTSEHPSKGKRRSGLHAARTTWLDRYIKLGNLPEGHSYALRRLGNLRPAARYGEPPLKLKEGELADVMQAVEELIDAAHERIGPSHRPMLDLPEQRELD